jgi:hypothetical protein
LINFERIWKELPVDYCNLSSQKLLELMRKTMEILVPIASIKERLGSMASEIRTKLAKLIRVGVVNIRKTALQGGMQ